MQAQPMPEISLLQGMGPFAWILIPCALLTLYTIIRRAIDVARAKTQLDQLYRDLHVILFWAGLTAILGLLGQIFGMSQAILAIITAADISPAIVMMGFRVSFYTTTFGLVTLMVAGIAWFVLGEIVRRRMRSQS